MACDLLDAPLGLSLVFVAVGVGQALADSVGDADHSRSYAGPDETALVVAVFEDAHIGCAGLKGPPIHPGSESSSA